MFSTKFNKVLIIVSIFFFSTYLCYSHNKVIKGQVLVKNGTVKPVIGASVRLEGTVLGSITDSEGRFIIKGVPDGEFNIIVSSIGMHTAQKTIELKHIEGDEYEVAFELVENPIKTSNVVVTATRSEKIYEDIPIKVSTLSEAELKMTSSNNLRESLQFQPGVRTEVNCQNCGFSQVRINGLEGKYSQILIDGRAIFSSLNGVYGLDQISTNMIDRIEVIRGGGSSLYGGNAIAGVINVITKEPCYNFFDISYNNLLVDGTYPENTLNINTAILNESQNMGFSAFGMINKRHEFDANGDGFTEIGRMDVKTMGGKLFWKYSSTSKLTAEFNAIQHEIRGGNKIDLMPHEADIAEQAKHNTLMAQLSYDHFFKNGNKITAYTSGQQTKRNSYYGAEQDLNAYGNTDNQTFAVGTNYQFIGNFIGNHVIIAGYELLYDQMQDYAPAYDRVIDQTAYSNGFFLQDDWEINRNFNLLYGARLDKHNLIDDLVINPRASLLFKPFDKLSVRATFSTGYRAPQAFDEDLHITQVGGEGFVILVDDNLLPEYSQSISGSIDYSINLFTLPLAFSLEYFHTQLNDVFTLVDNGEDVFGNRLLVRENGENAIVKGVTFEVQSSKFNSYSLKLGFTYQSSKYSEAVEWSAGDSEAGIPAQFSDEIFRTPDLYGYFMSSIDILHNLSLDLTGYYTGAMYVPHYAGYIDNDELKESETFFDLNAKINYDFGTNPNIRLSFGVQNLLNSYQSDFDSGIMRDAGYIYGPFRPMTFYSELKISI